MFFRSRDITLAMHGDCFASQLGVYALSSAVQGDILVAVSKALEDERLETSLSQMEAYRLLARTQIVPKILATVQGNSIALHEAISEIFDGLSKHLERCANVSGEAAISSREFLSEVAK